MGTNYYTRNKECAHCGRFEEIHLGKSSMGWQFSFNYNGGRFYKNVAEMKLWLEEKTIRNEYGDIISNDEFWEMVADKQNPKFKNHAEYVHKNYPEAYHATELVIGGYSFSDCDFS